MRPRPRSATRPSSDLSACNDADATRSNNGLKKNSCTIFFLQLNLALACCLFFTPPLLAAQKTNTEPAWYEIEVLIFARQTLEPGHAEIWSRFLNVSFPAKLIAMDTDFHASNLSYVAVPAAQSSDPASQAEPKLVPVLPPYTHIGPKNTALNQARQRLQRSGKFEILSHYHWVQPLVDRKESLPLLIQAGKVYGDQYELEGTVSLSVSRYLHIDAELWLSSFTENQALPDTWRENTYSNSYDTTTQLSNVQQTQSKQCTKHFNPASPQVSEEPGTRITDYITTQIAELKQSRRMRSGEIHYLDHPLFGVIVTVNPYIIPATAH